MHAPRGLKRGKDGARGANHLTTKDKRRVYLGGKKTVEVQPGEILQILTPRDGGWVHVDFSGANCCIAVAVVVGGFIFGASPTLH